MRLQTYMYISMLLNQSDFCLNVTHYLLKPSEISVKVYLIVNGLKCFVAVFCLICRCNVSIQPHLLFQQCYCHITNLTNRMKHMFKILSHYIAIYLEIGWLSFNSVPWIKCYSLTSNFTIMQNIIMRKLLTFI